MEECLGIARQRQDAGKLIARSPSPIKCGNRYPKLCWVDASKVGKQQKGPNFTIDGATNENNNVIKEKDVECPIR